MKKDWVADPRAFGTFVAWLDGTVDADATGASYVAMHGRLAAYFTRKGCRAAEDLADETLARVARRLAEEGTISGVAPAQYCYIVARFVWLEHLRSPEYTPPVVLREIASPTSRTEEDEQRERWLGCLDSCLQQIDPADRTIILGYYAGEATERIAKRRDLAAKSGLTANAIAIKASRLRERLRKCVGQCISQG